MKKELILAVSVESDDQFYDEQGVKPVSDISYLDDAIYKDIAFMPRYVLEDSLDYLHFATYVVLKNDNKVFMYRRTKKVGESRLAGNNSIGIGGHVDIADAKFTNGVFSIVECLKNALYREFSEEVDGVPSDNQYEVNIKGFIRDTSNSVGSVHIGVLAVVEVGDVELKMKEEELETVGWVDLEDVINDQTAENWSKIAAKFLLENS